MIIGSITPYCVYITSNPGRTTFYTGVTNDLERRMYEHYESRGNKLKFAGKYFCYELVYYECYPNMKMAIRREDEIKNLSHDKKMQLIKCMNPKLRRLVF